MTRFFHGTQGLQDPMPGYNVTYDLKADKLASMIPTPCARCPLIQRMKRRLRFLSEEQFAMLVNQGDKERYYALKEIFVILSLHKNSLFM